MKSTIDYRRCDGCKKEAQNNPEQISGVPAFRGWVNVSIVRKSMTDRVINKDFCCNECAVKFLQEGEKGFLQ